jgi:FemAB-related protein (PEP-CTERM system-associated)
MPVGDGVRTAPGITVSDQVSGQEWDTFVASHPAGTVEQLWGWRHVFQNVFGHEPVYLAARRDRGIVGVLPLVKFRSLLFGRSLISLPYANYAGLVTSDRDAAEALAGHADAIARAFGARSTELRHIERQLSDACVRQHKLGARLPLPATSEALWSTLDRKVRNQIRKAQKEGLTVEIGGETLIDDFYRVFAHNMRDLGTPVFPRALFVDTLRCFPELARVVVVRHRQAPIAAAVALGWRQSTLVPWASSLREYRPLCANMMLYWSMLEAAVGAGHTTFDFGRSTPGGGTHHFKQQWGAGCFPLHWEYVLPQGATPPDQGTSNRRLQWVIRAWQRVPLPIANALGPKLIRHIP